MFQSLQKILNDIMPDYVINLAGISFVEHGNVEDLYQANLIGVRNLLSCLSNLEKKPNFDNLSSEDKKDLCKQINFLINKLTRLINLFWPPAKRP